MTLPPKIKILVTNQKGGVGKSTISSNLAGYLAIEKNLQVTLVDFDRQGTSSSLINKNIHPNIQCNKAGLSYQQNSHVSLMEARSVLRRSLTNADIVVADLTWTFGLPYEFLLDFDLIIIPSSNSKVEIASTEIFILEYVQKQISKIEKNKQIILVAPSRIDRNQLQEVQFSGLSFLERCFICPPIFRISQINNQVLNDFWFRIGNNIIAENICEFCEFIFDKVQLKIEWLNQIDKPIPFRINVNTPINSTNPLNTSSNASKKLEAPSSKIYSASTTASTEKKILPIQGNMTRNQFSIIPAFLRKR